MNTKSKIKTLLILILVVLLGSNQNIAQNVGIGDESFTPHESAMLEVKSTTKGLLPPRMTTAERDLIQNPATGLQIFNTTTNCVEVYIYGIWQQMFCGVCPAPNPPTEGTHSPSATEIIWNWNSVAGADGYKWNTQNNYVAATDLGNTTTVTQTGLTCNTPYTIYVWAYNACGNSITLTLTQTTSADCPFACGTSTVTFTYKGSTVTYGTVVGAGSRCWLDRNLGATAVATSSTHPASYGDLFQWGRADDGHQNRNSNTTTTLSNTDHPAHGDFIRNSNTPQDWRSPQNINLWQGVNGVNNPCPNGWRVPTEAEWDAERLSWTPNNNAAGAFASPLKLPWAGQRDNNGPIEYTGAYGSYWSSTISTANTTWTRFLTFMESNASMGNQVRARGLSVRCIKD